MLDRASRTVVSVSVICSTSIWTMIELSCRRETRVRSTIAAKNVKRTEERRRKVALNETTKVSAHTSWISWKTDNLTFFNIMKNVKTAKPSSPTDTAGISASNV